MDARHIICACRIPGSDSTLGFEYEDYDEHGAGQVLLNYMEESDLDNRALFVVRKYDGQHIGPARFDCIVRAAKAAVNHKPYN